MCAKEEQEGIEKYSRAFVVGDIHGMYEPLKELLSNWHKEEQLVFLGDYIDRGPQILEVLTKVWQLEKEQGAICLRGNHEQMLLNFLVDPIQRADHYIRNGGWKTIRQLLQLKQKTLPSKIQAAELAQQIKRQYPNLLNWLDTLPYYYEFGSFICVHAGVDLSLNDWRQSSERDFLWIREPFFESENKTAYQFIFGHTPIQSFPPQMIQQDLFVKPGFWGIDGGAVYQLPKSRLIALRIDKDTVLSSHCVPVIKTTSFENYHGKEG